MNLVLTCDSQRCSGFIFFVTLLPKNVVPNMNVVVAHANAKEGRANQTTCEFEWLTAQFVERSINVQ